ncbi:MAG TPA: peptide chain release factor N(5)-glutamine methyltransferase [Candidatus Acidoferrales bacterium]|nr:peptide chain release factor N(5)-glutamine methyltransferase [Candidatus Acidoferrales bacterium]
MTANAKIDATLTVRSALRDGIAQLQHANTPSYALAAELLLIHAIGQNRTWIYAHPEEPLAAETARRFFELVAQRGRGVPTQYLTGKQEFWGIEFKVTPAVLIPRPETEHVIEVAIERIGERRKAERLRVADIGTGSGCIAIALAQELPHAEIIATDISAAALEVARQNAARHGTAERIRFLKCKLLDAIIREAHEKGDDARLFDLIVSNPPYVARDEESQLPTDVREHEPARALFGGASGTEIYAPLVAQAAELLRSGGLLVAEIGYGQAERVRALFDDTVWSGVRVTNDLAGIPRVLSAERV